MDIIIPLKITCKTCGKPLEASPLPLAQIPDFLTLEVRCPNNCTLKQVTINIKDLIWEKL